MIRASIDRSREPAGSDVEASADDAEGRHANAEGGHANLEGVRADADGIGPLPSVAATIARLSVTTRQVEESLWGLSVPTEAVWSLARSLLVAAEEL